jgi:penicillin-binding protein 1A
MTKLGVALLIALAGCKGDTPAPDDDSPRDLTALVECRGDAGRPVISVDKMPPHVPAAFLSAEDRRFYDRASGSPIVQMVVKLMPGIAARCIGPGAGSAVGSADKHRRKAIEANLTARLERELTKAQILSIYVNHVYLGHGAYGVVEAARTYFGKELARLTIAEAALLAGLVASPTKYAPHHNLPLARERQRHVLDKMREDRHISEAQYQAALAEPISLAIETTP